MGVVKQIVNNFNNCLFTYFHKIKNIDKKITIGKGMGITVGNVMGNDIGINIDN